MSTYFYNKEEALKKGFEYADRQDLEKLSIKEIIEHPDIHICTSNFITDIFGKILDEQTMLEFQNGKNQRVAIASCKFRDGFDLWLITPNGKACRV